MTTLTTPPAAAVAAAADDGVDDEAVSVWPASSCWSWRTPCAIPAAAQGRSVHPAQAYTQNVSCILHAGLRRFSQRSAD